jgi:hypothetical protein
VLIVVVMEAYPVGEVVIVLVYPKGEVVLDVVVGLVMELGVRIT